MANFIAYDPAEIWRKCYTIFALLRSDIKLADGLGKLINQQNSPDAERAKKHSELNELANIIIEQESRDLYLPIFDETKLYTSNPHSFRQWAERAYLESIMRQGSIDNKQQSFAEKVIESTKRAAYRLNSLQEITRESGKREYNAIEHSEGFSYLSGRTFTNDVLLGPDIFYGSFGAALNKHNKNPWCNFFNGYTVEDYRFNSLFVITNPSLPTDNNGIRYRMLTLLDKRFYDLAMLTIHSTKTPSSIRRLTHNYLRRQACILGIEDHDYMHGATLQVDGIEFRKNTNNRFLTMEANLPAPIKADLLTREIKRETLEKNRIGLNYMEAFSMQSNRDAWQRSFSKDKTGRLQNTVMRNLITTMEDASIFINYAFTQPDLIKAAGLQPQNISGLKRYAAYICLKPIMVIMPAIQIDAKHEYELWHGDKLSLTSAFKKLSADFCNLTADIKVNHREIIWLHSGLFNDLCQQTGADNVCGFLARHHAKLRAITAKCPG